MFKIIVLIANLFAASEGEHVLQFWQQKADQGDIEACINVANMFNAGEFIPRDVDQAIKYYKIAADNGNAQANCELGKLLYEQGKGIGGDLYLSQAANLGCPCEIHQDVRRKQCG